MAVTKERRVRGKTITESSAKREGKVEERPRRYLPVGLDISGWDCLVVGGGRVASGKAATLASHGAKVTVVAESVGERCGELVAGNAIVWIHSRYERSLLEGRALAVAATDDARLNAEIGRDAKALGILHCVVSPGRMSELVFPALLSRDGVTIAVLSDGKNPKRSRQMRDAVAAAFDPKTDSEAVVGIYGLSVKSAGEDVLSKFSRASEALGGQELKGTVGAPAFVLSTCQRMEFCFSSAYPEATGRRIRDLLHSVTGFLPEAHKEAFYLKAGPAAFYHSLRVALGLDSPIVGETEIVGQIRDAAAEAGGASGSESLEEFTDWVLRTSRFIRRKSGLGGRSKGWARAVDEFLTPKLEGTSGPVLIYGTGRLSASIARRLSARGEEVLLFTAHPRCELEAMAGSGIEVHPRGQAPTLLPQAKAIVLATVSMSPLLEAAEVRVAPDSALVVDLGMPPLVSKEGREFLGDRYAGLKRLEQEAHRDGDWEAIANAERSAFESALRRWAETHGRTVIRREVRVGLRPSALSQRQTAGALAWVELVVDVQGTQLVEVTTPGDRDRRVSLPDAPDDFFTRDLDEALLSGEIDLAIHSAKDVPHKLSPGLTVAALTPAFIRNECLVSRDGLGLFELPTNAVVGTSSERRRARLGELRPELKARDIRGNVEERVGETDRGEYDATILAAVGLIRLGLQERITEVFPTELFPPAPGQGSLALVARSTDRELIEALAPLDLGDRKELGWAKAK
jgi:hydroxymethylbilane synthase